MKMQCLVLLLTVGISLQTDSCSTRDVGDHVRLDPKSCNIIYCDSYKKEAIEHVPDLHGRKSTNCCSDPADKKRPLKRNGFIIEDGCVQKECKDGEWKIHPHTTPEDCKSCEIWADPRFEAFSGAQFEFHGVCNFALVQKGRSKTPTFGVFMDFTELGSISVVGPTTYQDSLNTKVELDPSDIFKVKVNNVKVTIRQTQPTILHGSVYGWKYDNCVRLYGDSKILVTLCEDYIHIDAPAQGASNPNALEGLCGSTAFTAINDQKLIARDGSPYENPGSWIKPADVNFANSWKAAEQTKADCKKDRRRKSFDNIPGDNMKICADVDVSVTGRNSTHYLACYEAHGVSEHTEDRHMKACLVDLCIANDPSHIAEGVTEAKVLAMHSRFAHQTNLHKKHTKKIAHGESCSIRNNEITSSETNVADLQTAIPINVNPSQCPPPQDRPVCRLVRSGLKPPQQCFHDSRCPGLDKCCYDPCLLYHACKAPTPQKIQFNPGPPKISGPRPTQEYRPPIYFQ